MSTRREFINSGLAAAALAALPKISGAVPAKKRAITLPPALKPGATIGLVTPASPLFEAHRTLLEAETNLRNLGYRTKAAKNIFKKNGYLAGSVQERVDDLHSMFTNPTVDAIMTIRGGYGSAQLLPHLDYDLIRRHPKILVGYSDITSLLNGIHTQTGLVTFHGPVAVSTFTDFTQHYFKMALQEPKAVGQIEPSPFQNSFQPINRLWQVKGGVAEGQLVGGNLTLMQSLIGTPYFPSPEGAILFFEEVGEEPYDLDRILNHMKQAGIFDKCRGVFFDRLDSTKPASYKPAFNSSLSVEEVLQNVFADYDFPVALGFSIGHIKNKPTLPIGIKARLDANAGQLTILEAAVR